MVNPFFNQHYVNFCEGNAGAMTVILELLNRVDGIKCLQEFDKLNIRGWKIWICYHDICRDNLETLIDKTLGGAILPLLKETRNYKYYEKQELTE